MNKIPHNQEHLEALQSAMDEQNEAHFASQSEGEQIKYAAIKKALGILVEAGVDDAFLFVGQNAPNGCYEHIHYNTMVPFIEYDERSFQTIDSKNKSIKSHASFAYGVNKLFTYLAGSSDIGEGNKLLMNNSYHYWNHIANGVEFPKIEK